MRSSCGLYLYKTKYSIELHKNHIRINNYKTTICKQITKQTGTKYTTNVLLNLNYPPIYLIDRVLEN